jgi:hypothetical protein
MTNVLWACSSDIKYKDKAKPYLESLVKSGITPTHLTVDWTPTSDASITGVEYVPISSGSFLAPSPINCLQHGDFLSRVPADRDVIVFTDCDIVCQRPLYESEQWQLEVIKEGQVWCSHNNGEGDSLLHEAIRLQPYKTLDEVFTTFKGSRHPMYMPIYNTGVLAMHKKTYQMVFENYRTNWPKIDGLMKGYAKQQWLLSYLFTEMGLDVRIWDESFHSHGCFNTVRPVPRRFKKDESGLYANSSFVLLRHNWSGMGDA